MAYSRQGDKPLSEPMMAFFAVIYKRHFYEMLKFALA